MIRWLYYLLAAIAFFVAIKCTTSQLSNNKDDLLNWCLSAKNHKVKPGKEDSLHSQCSPWKNHSCCTEEVTKDIHSTDMYNFTFDHCSEQTGRNMSYKCRRHFNQDNCFYECEPNIGLWVVKTNRKIAAERFYNVPLCASDCDSWFDACKDDFTCVQNWPREFKFSKGLNTCPKESECLTFKEIYQTSKTFCENVWDHSWSYTPDKDPCIRVWFNGDAGNPNRKTAEFYIQKHFNGATVSSMSILLNLFLSALIFTVI